jgi:hypothetical protein
MTHPLSALGVGALRRRLGKTVLISNDVRANLLSDYFLTFKSVCTIDNGITPTVRRVVPDSVSLDNIDFSPTRIFNAIKN